MASGILVEKERVVRECIAEAFSDNNMTLAMFENLPEISKELLKNQRLFVSSTSKVEECTLVECFRRVKETDDSIVTVLLSGNLSLLERSISMDSIDLRLPKGLGISQLIDELCKDVMRYSDGLVDFIETRVGTRSDGKEYWSQNYIVLARPGSIARKDQRKTASAVFSGKSKEEVLARSAEDALELNRKRAASTQLMLKRVVVDR